MESQTAHILLTSATDTTSTGRLMAVGEQKRSGLILYKAHHAEFAGPGAAIGTLVDQNCTTIIAIGSPEIVEVVTPSDRQTAYSRRIQWVRWLQKITEQPDPVQRVEKLFSSFEAFFGAQALLSLPDEVLALLIGVLPTTIAIVRSQYRPLGKPNRAEPPLSCRKFELGPLTLDHRDTIVVSRDYPAVAGATNFFEALDKLPCSA